MHHMNIKVLCHREWKKQCLDETSAYYASILFVKHHKSCIRITVFIFNKRARGRLPVFTNEHKSNNSIKQSNIIFQQTILAHEVLAQDIDCSCNASS